MEDYIHSLPTIGSKKEIFNHYPNLHLETYDCPVPIWYHNNIGLEELANDCGTLYIHNLKDITKEDLIWLHTFTKKHGYCMIIGTLVCNPILLWNIKHQDLLRRYKFKKVGQCPSSRHPEKTKTIYLKTLQQTVRGYPTL